MEPSDTPRPDKAALSVLQKSVVNLPGIGTKFKDALQKFKISTLRDVLFSFPYRFEVLKDSLYGEKGVLWGAYENYSVIRTRGGKKLLKAVFRSERGFVAGMWLNFKGDYPVKSLKSGAVYYFYGAVTKHDGMFTIFHPEFITPEDIGSVRPVYSIPGGVSQGAYRKAAAEALKTALPHVEETLPPYILDKYGFPGIRDAISTLHSPETEANVTEIAFRTHPAYKRFVYEEFFYLQIALEIRRRTYARAAGIKFSIDKDLLNGMKRLMPFKLTGAQRRTLVEIFNDMMKPRQMNRLVQGDVGSGKTVIAFLAGAAAVANGYQVILIAPTEVLAEQHFYNMQKFFRDAGYSVCLMTGSVGRKDKTETRQLIASGAVNFIVGTHALLEENVEFYNLGLAIIDEQHRFGVHQRKIIVNKGIAPDVILMTATPIPRTLAMTIYGDLDISVIDEMPPGRIPCVTKYYPASKLAEAFAFVKEILDKGMKAYFVYPLIDESDKLELKAATQSFEHIKKYFKNKTVGLLHGRMKSEEKRALLSDFKNGRVDILVSTTVVEVGVDIPEATVMLIENAERFGLSQLHQLRGRVGRNSLQSYCLLITSKDISESGRKRINAMVKYSDGFKLAEVDMELRGQGDFFGTKQSGMPEFKFADIVSDTKILKDAINDARAILEEDGELSEEKNETIRKRLESLYSDGTSYLGIG